MVGGSDVLRSTYFEPLQAFSPTTSFTIVTIAILGGSDEVPGPLLGAVLLVLMSELLWARAPEIYMIILGALLVAFVLLASGGLVAGRAAALCGAARGCHCFVSTQSGKSLWRRPGAVDDVSFDGRAGEIVGLMGANGAGKTTLFGLIAGTQRPTSGKSGSTASRIDGKPPYASAALGVARTFQIVRPFAGLTRHRQPGGRRHVRPRPRTLAQRRGTCAARFWTKSGSRDSSGSPRR